MLVNGSLTREFGVKMGLHQGDLLSPLLFNVAIEGLSALLNKAVYMSYLKGAVLGSGEIQFPIYSLMMTQSCSYNQKWLTLRMLGVYYVVSNWHRD